MSWKKSVFERVFVRDEIICGYMQGYNPAILSLSEWIPRNSNDEEERI